MKIAKIYFIINVIIFSITSFILVIAIFSTNFEAVGTLILLICIIALIFSISQIIVSIALVKIIKISTWTENNQRNLSKLLNSQISVNNVVSKVEKANSEFVSISPKRSQINSKKLYDISLKDCQCLSCEFNDENGNSKQCLCYNPIPNEVLANVVACETYSKHECRNF